MIRYEYHNDYKQRFSWISIVSINFCFLKGNAAVQSQQLPNTGTDDVQMITSNADEPPKALSPPAVAPHPKPITVCN